MTRTQHLAVFYSPGTFFHEEMSIILDKPTVAEAVAASKGVVERYGATPFGFQIVEQIVGDPVPDGRGGTLDVMPKKVRTSGMYFLGGRLRKLDDIEAVADPSESILVSNMRANDQPVVVENTNSWKSTHVFGENDVLLDATGEPWLWGNDPYLIEYRRRTVERVKRERGY